MPTTTKNDSLARMAIPRLTVDITQADIDTAVAGNSGHCMIADAMKRCFYERFKRKPFAVSVDLQTIRLTDRKKNVRYIYLTPLVAQRGLLQFDQAIKITPYKFRVQGGQIVRSKKTTAKINKRSESQKTATANATKAFKKKIHDRASLRVQNTSNQTAGNLRTKIGGKAPPLAVLTGNRRQWGIRAAGNLNSATA